MKIYAIAGQWTLDRLDFTVHPSSFITATEINSILTYRAILNISFYVQVTCKLLIHKVNKKAVQELFNAKSFHYFLNEFLILHQLYSHQYIVSAYTEAQKSFCQMALIVKTSYR